MNDNAFDQKMLRLMQMLKGARDLCHDIRDHSASLPEDERPRSVVVRFPVA